MRLRKPLSVLVPALALISQLALAQGNATIEAVATDVRPNIRIAGSATDEKATFEFGASWQHGIGREFAFIVLPSFSVATAKGLASVLSWRVEEDQQRPQENTPWTLQTSLAFLNLTKAQNPSADDVSRAYDERKVAAAHECIDACANTPSTSFCKPLMDAIHKPTTQDLCPLARADFVSAMERAEASPDSNTKRALLYVLLEAVRACRDQKDDPSRWKPRYKSMFSEPGGAAFVVGKYAFPEELNRSELCAVAKQKLKRLEPVVSEYPVGRISIGASVGGAKFENLKQIADAPLQYTPSERHRYQYKVGLAGTRVFSPFAGLSPTAEMRGAFLSQYVAQTKKGRWCEAAGDVVPDQELGTTVPLESCRELAIGEPLHKESVELTVHLGLIDQREQLWRVALGPEIRLKTGGTGQPVMHWGVSLPLYLNVVRFFSAAQYKGLLRVSPGVFWDENEKGQKGRTYSISLALLGERYFFSSKFDEF